MKSYSGKQTAPPISEGDECTGFIDSVGEKGDGVLRVKGFVVFVPQVRKGDYVKVKITKVLPKVSFGSLIEKLDPPKKPDLPPPLPSKRQKEKEEIAELLTTDGDSEDFGEEDDEDEENR